jgi:hypothetical protein
MTDRPPIPLRRKLLLMAGSTAVTLAAAELSLRVLGIGGMVVFTQHPAWGFLMTPSQEVRVYGHAVAINALGLRGPEVRPQKSPGGVRLLFIGDSVTYGGGRIREEELFVRRVEAAARDLVLDAEAINLSAPAWSPQNWAAYVDARGFFDADVLVLVLPECDFARPFATIESGGHQEEAPWLRVAGLAMRVKYLIERRVPILRTGDAWAKRVAQPDPGELEDVVAANVKALRAVRARAGSIPMLTVMVPTRTLAVERFWPRFKAEAGQVLELDRDLDDPGFFMDGVHLNGRGHEIVGERIFSTVRPLLRAHAPSGLR